jgi:uncharacterized membrane protein YsdA (DUF1294 family)
VRDGAGVGGCCRGRGRPGSLGAGIPGRGIPAEAGDRHDRAWGYTRGMLDDIAWFYLGLLVLMSGVTLVLYRWDKRQAAKQGRKRVAEATLHLMELLGGWLGGAIARMWFRHKSKKLSFRVRSWGIVALHVALIAGWCWMKFR